MKICSVYQLRNIVNGKVYVGSSTDTKGRFRGHRSHLRGGYHPNKHLQSAWNSYGEDKFVFEIIEQITPDQIVVCEQKWIDKTNCTDERFGYNNNPSSVSRLGVRASEKTRIKCSVAQKKRWLRPEEHEKQSQAIKRANLRPGVIQKRSIAIKKVWSNQSFRQKMIQEKREM